jgi:hypothetical protein
MNRKITLIIVFLLSFQFIFAQSKLDSLSEFASRQPRLIVKWAPLSIIDPHSTVQLGLEYLFAGPWSFQQEIGYGNNFEVISENDYLDREIWRFRSEIRKYMDDFKPKGRGAYIGFEVLYKRVNYTKEGRIGRDCEDGDCEFFEIMEYKILKDVIGVHGKFGGQFVIDNRLVVDIYMGGGLRNITVKSPGYPTNPAMFRDEEIGFIKTNPTMPGNHTLISMSGGFKLGYMIYHKKKKTGGY